jgi:bile acid:Na+ symporter, BASS family
VKYLIATTVLILMVSIGMSLEFGDLMAQWRRLTLAVWVRLLLATFILPPLIALGLGQLLPLTRVETGGLFLIAIAPGAPLMTRNIAKRGFDMRIAASYQVWGALLIPIMIPLLVLGAGKIYGRDIWIPPLRLLALICKQQLLPLFAGMALMYFAPVFSTKIRRALNVTGNLILTIALVALLWKLGPALRQTTAWLLLAVLLLALGCMGVSQLLLTRKTAGVQTLVISNVNRHVGLALLISGQYLQNSRALPVLACYALTAPILMGIYAKFVPPGDAVTSGRSRKTAAVPLP